MAPISKPRVQYQMTFLREWRRRNNLSQEQAARELNISRPLLSQIENAKSPYNQRLIETAAVLYQCTPAEIIGGPGLIDHKTLRSSIKSVDDFCRERGSPITPDEKADMVVGLYREAIKAIRQIPPQM